nr:hypothetical protein Iba_chr01aCG4230 [Ipomoea batatas]
MPSPPSTSPTAAVERLRPHLHQRPATADMLFGIRKPDIRYVTISDGLSSSANLDAPVNYLIVKPGAFAEKGNGGVVTFISVEVLRFPRRRATSSKLVGDVYLYVCFFISAREIATALAMKATTTRFLMLEVRCINGSLADSRRLPLWIGSMQDRSQNISLSDYGNSEGGKSMSDDEDGGEKEVREWYSFIAGDPMPENFIFARFSDNPGDMARVTC